MAKAKCQRGIALVADKTMRTRNVNEPTRTIGHGHIHLSAAHLIPAVALFFLLSLVWVPHAWAETQDYGDFSVTTTGTPPVYASGILFIPDAGTYSITMKSGVVQTSNQISITASSGTVELALQGIDILSGAPTRGLLNSTSSNVDTLLTIEGNNSIVNTDSTSPYPEAIDIPGNLTIGGTGSLYASASEGAQFDYALYAAQSYDTTLTLRDSVRIQADSDNPALSPRYGACCMNLAVQDSASLEAHGRQYGIFALQDITLEGANVQAIANGLDIPDPTTAAVQPDNFLQTSTLVGSDTIPFSTSALCSYGSLTCASGTISATSTASKGVGSFGIIAVGNLSISNANVYGEGITAGIFSLDGNLSVLITAGESVEGQALGESGAGIAAFRGIAYSPEALIVLPERGRIIETTLAAFPNETFFAVAEPNILAPALHARIAMEQPTPPDPPIPPNPKPTPSTPNETPAANQISTSPVQLPTAAENALRPLPPLGDSGTLAMGAFAVLVGASSLIVALVAARHFK